MPPKPVLKKKSPLGAYFYPYSVRVRVIHAHEKGQVTSQLPVFGGARQTDTDPGATLASPARMLPSGRRVKGGIDAAALADP